MYKRYTGGKIWGKIAGSAIEKKILADEKAGKILTQEMKTEMKTSAIKKGQAGLMLIGVCLAAGVIIPAVCSLLVTPIMKVIRKNGNTENKLDVKESVVIPPQRQLILPQKVQMPQIYKNFASSGMKVGAL